MNRKVTSPYGMRSAGSSSKLSAYRDARSYRETRRLFYLSQKE